MDPWRSLARLSKKEIIDLQNRKLHSFINSYVYPFSPYYRRVFDQNNIHPEHIHTIKDLKNLPLTSKIDFIDPPSDHLSSGKGGSTPSDLIHGMNQQGVTFESFKDFILQPDAAKIKKYWPRMKLLSLAMSSCFKGREYLDNQLEKEFRPVFMTFTTGTTHKPVPFLYSNYDIQNLHISGARMLQLFNIKTTENIVNMFPYAPHLAFWQVVWGGLASNTLILSTGGGKTIGTDGNIRAIVKMRPSVILGVPSYVYYVLREAKEQNCDMSFVKKIVLGAARVTQAFKIRLAELLESMGAKNVSVFGTYGFTEARAAWAECPTPLNVSSGYHLYADKEIFEIIDPVTGEVKGEGEDGEIVYTSLDARGSVVLRYRTGDFVKGGITYEPCPYCQRRCVRISSDITRLSDIKDLHLSKIKGALVNLNNFSSCLSEISAIEEWQIEIKKRNNDPFDVDELVVYVSSKNGADQNKLAEEIRKKISVTTEVTPNRVEFLSLDEIVKRLELETANKEKRIIDSRPKE